MPRSFTSGSFSNSSIFMICSVEKKFGIECTTYQLPRSGLVVFLFCWWSWEFAQFSRYTSVPIVLTLGQRTQSIIKNQGKCQYYSTHTDVTQASKLLNLLFKYTIL